MEVSHCVYVLKAWSFLLTQGDTKTKNGCSMGRGLHMIIYYHCNSDNALLLSFFTNLPSLHPLSFHEMIFIPCSTNFKDGILSDTLSEGTVLVCYNNTYGTVWLGFEGANGEAHTISDCPCIL